jgi:hypothetical protein
VRMRIIAGCAITVAVWSLAPTDAGSQQTTSSATTSCEPVFKPTEYYRGIPYAYVDQGLVSLTGLYPKHVLLVQRRFSEIGAVHYSLLVFREDPSKPDVRIEGMATHNDTRAWFFLAHCSTENVMEGIVTTLERVAKLSTIR